MDPGLRREDGYRGRRSLPSRSGKGPILQSHAGQRAGRSRSVKDGPQARRDAAARRAVLADRPGPPGDRLGKR